MKKFIIALMSLNSLLAVGQEVNPATKFTFNIEGQIALTTDGKGMYMNLGGPALKFNFKHLTLAANLMPSLRFQNETPKPLVTPMLGFGPQVYFLKNKRCVLSFPCYYNTLNHRWKYTAGIGFVLTRKK